MTSQNVLSGTLNLAQSNPQPKSLPISPLINDRMIDACPTVNQTSP